MKFHLSTQSGNIVTGLGPGWVRIGATEYRENLVLTPEAIASGWAASGFDGLADSDFAALLPHKPDEVLRCAIGSPVIRKRRKWQLVLPRVSASASQPAWFRQVWPFMPPRMRDLNVRMLW